MNIMQVNTNTPNVNPEFFSTVSSTVLYLTYLMRLFIQVRDSQAVRRFMLPLSPNN